jgi:hypothetical protein
MPPYGICAMLERVRLGGYGAAAALGFVGYASLILGWDVSRAEVVETGWFGVAG